MPGLRAQGLFRHKSISGQNRYYYGSMIRQASDEGVTEIIGFVLIMGLVAVVLFVMALVVPPMTGAEMEGELALGAVQDISDLKYDMDLLWEDSTLPNVTRSVLIQLSTPKRGIVSMLPVFTPTVGSATLTAERSDLRLYVSGTDITPQSGFVRLTYSTSNNYAADAVVMYDTGAVFGGTRDAQSMLLVPSVGTGSDGSVLIVVPEWNESVSASSVSGNSFGVVAYTAGIGTKITYEGVDNVTVSSGRYPDVAKAWNRVLSDAGLGEGEFAKKTVIVKSVPYRMFVSAQGAVL